MNKLKPVMMDLTTLLNTISGPSAWRGDDLQNRQNEWLIHLQQDQIRELETAAQHYLSLGRDIDIIKKEDFPLTTFSKHLKNYNKNCFAELESKSCAGVPLNKTHQKQLR